MPKPRVENVLAAVPLFDGLTKRQLKQVAGLTEVAHYMEGHSVVREGEPGESFFVVLQGQAKVTIGGKRISRVQPGDHFGEISLLDGGPRSATVTSETPMTILMITRRNFGKLLADDADVSKSLLASLARMLRRADKSLTR